jgi:hypothetical protein
MVTETKQQEETDKQRRERSTIAFPYGDLDGAVEVALALNNNGGMGDLAQLSAWMGHKTVESGTFKVKLYSARSFGLVTIKESNIALTDLGNEIVRPESEARARALAFLHVPLYRAVYDNYKGKLIPGDAVLESDMVDLGVAAKQKSRARQGFRRSAEQAKLGKDRLVMPGGVSLDSKPNGGASRKMDQPNATQIAAGELNPMLLSLIEELPATGEWSRDERDLWARLFLRMVDKTYKVKE